MKGIILAGGSGTRLSPSTSAISKHLLPIYDKPMVYYPLATLMQAGIREILIISTKEHLPLYEEIFHDGSQFGLKISYTVQEKPRGIAEAFIIGEDFIGHDPVALILGDNVFYGMNFGEILTKDAKLRTGGIIFGYYVDNPNRYGVLEFDKNNNVISVVEKPVIPMSHYAVPGLYFFDYHCVEYAKRAKPSARGELEITDVINEYIKVHKLKVELLGLGFAWLDTGTHESLMDASNFVHTIEKRQGIKIACLEEIAYQKGFITFDDLKKSVKSTAKSEYGDYLKKLVERLEETKH